jgi:hypothetical protein
VTAGVVVLGGAVTAGCGVGGYEVWWDQDKHAVVDDPPIGGSTSGGGGGATHHDGGASGDGGAHAGDAAGGPTAGALKTVFYVLMARQPWANILGSPSAPYINHTLLPAGAHAERYYAAPDQIGQSLPNLVWLEAGGDLGFTRNVTPSVASSGMKGHLVDELEAAGVTWKAYVEGAVAGACPIADNYPYRTFHVPFLYFDDVAGTPPSAGAKRCVAHVVPFAQLAADLAAQAVPAYAFIVPDMCDNMHDDCNTGDPVRQGDDWLAAHVPGILGSKAYAGGAAVFIAWDFSPTGYDPIGFIALSHQARAGFASNTMHTTSSTLRSLQAIFGVSPLIGDAANANDVGEMFTSFP